MIDEKRYENKKLPEINKIFDPIEKFSHFLQKEDSYAGFKTEFLSPLALTMENDAKVSM